MSVWLEEIRLGIKASNESLKHKTHDQVLKEFRRNASLIASNEMEQAQQREVSLDNVVPEATLQTGDGKVIKPQTKADLTIKHAPILKDGKTLAQRAHEIGLLLVDGLNHHKDSEIKIESTPKRIPNLKDGKTLD